MQRSNLKSTKVRLSIMFAWLVFVIAFILELVYFTFRFVNFSYVEWQEFETNIINITNLIKKDQNFLQTFLNQKDIFRPIEKWKFQNKDGKDPWFRFLSFIVTDDSWNLVFNNIKENITKELDLSKLQDWITITSDWILLKKVDISSFWEYKNIYFFKKQVYSLEDYFKDLSLFFLITAIFSILFYYIWYVFVNKNLKPVEEIILDMTDFVHNASHELKTPIAVISSNMQMLKATKFYDEELVIDSIQEIKRIDWLIVWLTELSNIKSTQVKEDLDLKKEIEEIIWELKTQIDKKNIKLDFKIQKDWIINANKQYFYMLFSNLLRNAIRYNNENWTINIVLDKQKFSISNTWYWIEKEDLEKIFYRFYKTEKSRSSEGFWIWLSIVKKICDIYNWQIKVTSEVNKLTTFEIHF